MTYIHESYEKELRKKLMTVEYTILECCERLGRQLYQTV